MRLYEAAVAGANPAPATAAAVSGLSSGSLGGQRIWIIALGKASLAMAAAACDALEQRGLRVHAGLVVTHDSSAPAILPGRSQVAIVTGDHPEPGTRSLAASQRLLELTKRVAPDDTVLVLVSGGTSSLVAAPVDQLDAPALHELSARLLASGAGIGIVNAARRRVSRWGAGRLAVALAPARVIGLLASDVPGDDPATIGSGPCTADPLSAPELVALLETHRLRDALPPAVADHLADVAAGRAPGTPAPDDAAFARVKVRVVISRDAAIDAAERAARRDVMCRVVRHPDPLAGDAADCGRAIASALLDAHSVATIAELHLWAGEPSVTLGGEHGLGGRAQELALAASAVLDGAAGITLLAAGTDGRDGPTDAAGAIVDGATWAAVRSADRNPAHDLARHDAYSALDAANALLRTGATGVNAADIVLALVQPVAHDAGARPRD